VSLADFRSWKPDEVKTWLDQHGLHGDQRTGKSGAVPQGQVFKQEPSAGTDVKRGDTITYWVSSGKPQASVPDLSSLTQAEAQATLTAAGLVLGTVNTEASTSVPSGQVIRQDPTAGTKVAKGSAVSIVVSNGTPTASPSPTASGVTVPNVYGMDSTTAADQLSALGFTVVVKQKAGTGQPPGQVFKVTPDSGSVLPSGATVVLTIAK
jgi:eukaryotic-like serine/threonine-protein kinase